MQTAFGNLFLRQSPFCCPFLPRISIASLSMSVRKHVPVCECFEAKPNFKDSRIQAKRSPTGPTNRASSNVGNRRSENGYPTSQAPNSRLKGADTTSTSPMRVLGVSKSMHNISRHVDSYCPAHRTLIVRKLKGLEDIIPYTSVHWEMLEKGQCKKDFDTTNRRALTRVCRHRMALRNTR